MMKQEVLDLLDVTRKQSNEDRSAPEYPEG